MSHENLDLDGLDEKKYLQYQQKVRKQMEETLGIVEDNSIVTTEDFKKNMRQKERTFE